MSDENDRQSPPTSVLPDVSDAEIGPNAWLIWSAIKSDPKFRQRVTNRFEIEGRPGFHWKGSVNAFVNKLWPALLNDTLVDKATADNIKLTLNRYLRNTGNLICRKTGTQGWPGTASVWWVSEHWAEMTVSSKAPVDDVLIDDPGAVFDLTADTVPDGLTEEKAVDPVKETYACRVTGCDQTFVAPQGRAGHERGNHGMAINDDGTFVSFDPTTKLSTEEIHKLVLDTLKAAGRTITVMPLWQMIRQVDPRLSKNVCRDALLTMVADPTVPVELDPDLTSEHFQYFRMVPEVAAPLVTKQELEEPPVIKLKCECRVKKGTVVDIHAVNCPMWEPPAKRGVIENLVTIADAEKVEVKDVKPAEAPRRTLAPTPKLLATKPVKPMTASDHVASLRRVLDEMDRLSDVATQLRLMTEERDALQAANDNLLSLTQELVNGTTREVELQQQLDQVTAERDALQTRLDAIRQNLLGE